MMLTLKSQNSRAVALGDHKIWQGVSRWCSSRTRQRWGTQFKYTTVNLQEVTNRINVEVELHESVLGDTDPRDYVIEISSANGTMNIDGTMPLNKEVLNYPTTIAYSDNSLTASYSLMDLKTGYNNPISVKNVVTDEVIWQGDLAGNGPAEK